MTRQEFVFRIVVPPPEATAWLIRSVDDRTITRDMARSLMSDHAEIRMKRAEATWPAR